MLKKLALTGVIAATITASGLFTATPAFADDNEGLLEFSSTSLFSKKFTASSPRMDVAYRESVEKAKDDMERFTYITSGGSCEMVDPIDTSETKDGKLIFQTSYPPIGLARTIRRSSISTNSPARR